MARDPKLIDKLFSVLPPGATLLLSASIAAADRLGIRLYLVGGPVRDLLLDRPLRDIDVAAEGDAALVASQAAESTGGAVLKRSEFGTASIRLGDSTIDIAMSRSESYRRPGALPSVQLATIYDDLLRRDFTVNAMAISLGGEEAGALLDPAGGMPDLQARAIRVLHDGSFQDDATRIIRAVRYEQRLGFAIEPHTEALIRRDSRFLGTISGARLRRELQRTLGEPAPGEVLPRLDELGALAAIHPNFRFTAIQADALRAIETEAYLPGAAWTILGWDIPGISEADAIGARLALTKTESDLVAAAPGLHAVEKALEASTPSSRIDAILSPFPKAALFALAAITRSDPVRRSVLDYLRRLRYIRPALHGDDLISLGVPVGPMVGDVLARLRTAKLDGEVKSRRDEQAMVRKFLANKAPNDAG